MRPGIPPVTDSAISILHLSDYVNRYFPDILPKTFSDHYWHTERPTGDFDKNVKYSTRSRNNDRDILADLPKTGEKVGNPTFKIYLIGRRMIDFTAGVKRNKDLYRLRGCLKCNQKAFEAAPVESPPGS